MDLAISEQAPTSASQWLTAQLSQQPTDDHPKTPPASKNLLRTKPPPTPGASFIPFWLIVVVYLYLEKFKGALQADKQPGGTLSSAKSTRDQTHTGQRPSLAASGGAKLGPFALGAEGGGKGCGNALPGLS